MMILRQCFIGGLLKIGDNNASKAFESIMRGLQEAKAMGDGEMSKSEIKRLKAQIANASQLDLAKIGLNALVDEATGYQEIRPRDGLRKQLDAKGK